MIRLVALDIDGTLLDSSNRLSDGHAAAGREAAALGDERRYMMFTTVDHVTYMRPQGKGPKHLPRDMRVSNYHAQAVAQAAPTAILIFGEEAVGEGWDAFYEQVG